MTLERLRTVLADRLTPDGERWLIEATGRVAAEVTAVRTLFPAVGRRCGRGPLAPPTTAPDAAPEHRGWTVDDAARALLLAALPLRGDALCDEVAALYRYGDAAEKRGVLRALHLLDRDGDLGDRALPLVRDALRTNDTRLVAAALGPYGAGHLDAPAYRHGVLKCVFVGVPLAEVDGLDRRSDAELARMLVDFAHERVAAGRDVPADVWPVVDRYPHVLEASGLPAELSSEVAARRAAAARALADRTSARRTKEA